MAEVYDVLVKDSKTQHEVKAAHKRTAEGARLLRATIIPESEEEVEASSIDEQGRYVPAKSRA
ncbi:hypothetical protein GCM10011611_57030 [Aliidongia dinghuensis]|uniref:Uncharacterized protein n=1 Tax=Aliidongia dinghuensis TaxID=1867774 RepID=A0A8J2YZJ1_9PROT|nr:hypothetical protein [Aliidongia dinghuensis]GGF43198.1 hypothetical protein GCM10011611_57030 [Aliidongia dinghuensis]